MNYQSLPFVPTPDFIVWLFRPDNWHEKFVVLGFTLTILAIGYFLSWRSKKWIEKNHK